MWKSCHSGSAWKGRSEQPSTFLLNEPTNVRDKNEPNSMIQPSHGLDRVSLSQAMGSTQPQLQINGSESLTSQINGAQTTSSLPGSYQLTGEEYMELTVPIVDIPWPGYQYGIRGRHSKRSIVSFGYSMYQNSCPAHIYCSRTIRNEFGFRILRIL